MDTNNLGNLVEQAQVWLGTLGLRIVGAIVIFLMGRWIAATLKRVFRKVLTRAKVDSNLVSFSGNLIYYGVIAFVVLVILGQLGIQTTSLVALIGAAGLAIGLALQGSLSNFASGILIVIFHPFYVGDWIEGAGVTGHVEEIEIFTTVLRTFDNRTVIIPNSSLMNGNIINYSTKKILRLDFTVSVAYSEDIDRVKLIISEVLTKDERILKDPAPVIGVRQLAESSVNFAVRPWINTSNYMLVTFSFHENVKKRLDAEGIKIPFPQQDVHIYKE